MIGCLMDNMNRRDGLELGGKMSSSQLVRVSGVALLVGAVAYIVYVVLRAVMTAGVEPTSVALQGLWVPLNALGLIGALLTLL